jgi:hypothetical protein
MKARRDAKKAAKKKKARFGKTAPLTRKASSSRPKRNLKPSLASTVSSLNREETISQQRPPSHQLLSQSSFNSPSPTAKQEPQAQAQQQQKPHQPPLSQQQPHQPQPRQPPPPQQQYAQQFAHPKLTEFPQIILPIGMELKTTTTTTTTSATPRPKPSRPGKKLPQKIQTMQEVLSRLTATAPYHILSITLKQVLQSKYSRVFFQKVGGQCPRREQLLHLFNSLRLMANALLVAASANTLASSTHPLRIVLVGFEDALDSNDIQLLREVLMGDHEHVTTATGQHQFRLGLLVLNANDARFIKQSMKSFKQQQQQQHSASSLEAHQQHLKDRLAQWHSQYDSVIAQFSKQHVCSVARMQDINRVVNDVLVYIFKQKLPLVLQEQEQKQREGTVSLIASTLLSPVPAAMSDRGTQTMNHIQTTTNNNTATSTPHFVKGDRIRCISEFANGAKPLPTNALRQHSTTSTFSYASRSTAKQTTTLVAKPPPLSQQHQHQHQHQHHQRPVDATNQQIELELYHKYVGWLSVLQIECGHPDDWDRSFSNAYLFGKILACYTHRSSSSASSAVGIFSCLKNMQTGYSSTAKQHNFILVSAERCFWVCSFFFDD